MIHNGLPVIDPDKTYAHHDSEALKGIAHAVGGFIARCNREKLALNNARMARINGHTAVIEDRPEDEEYPFWVFITLRKPGLFERLRKALLGGAS